MKIALLTSSRADFGIQLPLLRALYDAPFIQPTIIAFGSHLDPRFGGTIVEVRAAARGPLIELPHVLSADAPIDISQAMGDTMGQFSRLWNEHTFDGVVCLGDRYEMFAAVAAALPFGLKVVHLHGGETTTGAIDNALRHSITHMAHIHFTAAGPYRERVVQLLGNENRVHFTGALSIDNLRTLELLDVGSIRDRFKIDLSQPTALITYHPETVDRAHFDLHWNAFSAALRSLAGRYQLLVTLPNADTGGLRLRQLWNGLLAEVPAATGVESLGVLGYLSCMKHCAFLLGNSSSGYVEASFFPKHVIDVGERQTGRLVTPNIHRCPMDTNKILGTVAHLEQASIPDFTPPYGDGHAAEHMVALIQRYL